MENRLSKTKINLEKLNKQFENAKVEAKVPFDKEQVLQEKTKRLAEVNKKLEIKDNESEIIEDVEIKDDEEKVKSQEYDKEPIR